MVLIGLISLGVLILMVVLMWPLGLVSILVGHGVARYKGKTIHELLADIERKEKKPKK